MSKPGDVTVSRVGDIVCIDDHNGTADYFQASQVESIDAVWGKDAETPECRITMRSGRRIQWWGLRTRTVAKIVWPEAFPPETLLEEAEKKA